MTGMLCLIFGPLRWFMLVLDNMSDVLERCYVVSDPNLMVGDSQLFDDGTEQHCV